MELVRIKSNNKQLKIKVKYELKIISTFANKQLLFIAAACDSSVLVEVVAECEATVLVEAVVFPYFE
ncbi:hypothetical protein BpHYR1_009967 [Brachionus plicatilis]|uniref:Uncharacterized protein n=1 Tax=Brachionus plicatilis TaxID=10195 RepID=A0A3M7PX10_BRAPC|nr:hypothetical protein BpHYR1_009967 [Brachionus plicatilis]